MGHQKAIPWERHGWLTSVIWLLYLAYPVSSLLAVEEFSWREGLALMAIAAFAVLYTVAQRRI